MIDQLPSYYRASSDSFSRYFLIKETLKKVFGNKKIKILDIGGKANPLFAMIKDENLPYDLSVIDILPPDESTKKYNYIQGDATNMEFKDCSFDAVVSADVLEHIPDEKKEAFVKEAVRVTKDIAIIAAPFDSIEVDYAEHVANNFFVKLTGEDHPWLKEHFETNKPKEKELQKILTSLQPKVKYISQSSNYIQNWINNILLHFIEVRYPELTNEIESINEYFNQNFLELRDNECPSYRKFYIIYKNTLDTQGINKLFTYEYNAKKHVVYSSNIFQIIQKIINSKDLIIQNKEIKIREKGEHLKNIDNIIKIMKDELQYKNKYMTDLQNTVNHLNEINMQITAEKEGLKSVLNNITSAKVFKIWQGFNKIKKKILRIPDNSKVDTAVDDKDLLIKADASKNLTINEQYEIWINNNYPTAKELRQQKQLSKKFMIQPKISILLPTYNTDPGLLKKAIDSVLNQSYENWELCIADDKSDNEEIVKVIKDYSRKFNKIKHTIREVNGHICESSNSAFDLATGEYISLLDHDDFLWPNALYEVISVINQYNKPDFIYSDEDKISETGKNCCPFFKPDWSPDLLRTANYITHFAVIKRSVITKIGAFRKGYEGAQDWDIFLRATYEISKKKHNKNNIVHIPKILYSWRMHDESTAGGNIIVKSYAIKAQEKSLNADLQKRNISADVLPIKHENQVIYWRTKYKIKGQPLVSIVIPTKDAYNYISKCLESLIKKTSYKNYELLITDTGTTSKKVLELYKNIKLLHKNTRILKWTDEFNFATVCNFAVDKAKGEYVLLLNNDTEVITPEWIEGLLEHAQRPEIGAVGCKLLYPDNTVQHAGVTLGLTGNPQEKGVAGHAFKRLPNNTANTLLNGVRNTAAVTAACLMISKEKYLEVKGQDTRFQIAFNDIDFNLKLMKKGYLNLYTGHVELYHHESVSVGDPGKTDDNKRDLVQFAKEINLMHDRWGDLLQNDPYYNPNLTLNREDWSIRIN